MAARVVSTDGYDALMNGEGEEWTRVEPLGCWQIMKELMMSILCFWDFVSDVLAAQANCHDDGQTLKFLGYFGGGMLVLSCCVNHLIIYCLRLQKVDFFEGVIPKAPALWLILRLLATTSPEILTSFLVLTRESLNATEAVDSELVGNLLKRMGLLSQLVEDIPQFAIQAFSVVLRLQHGTPVPILLWISVGSTMAMVLFKIVTNCLVAALGTTVSRPVILKAAAHHQRTVNWLPQGVNGLHFFLHIVITIGNVVFLFAAYEVPVPYSLPSMDGCLSVAVLFLCSYFLAVGLVLVLVRMCRDILWHCRLSLELSAALACVASVHPASLLQITPALPSEGGLLWKVLIVPVWFRCFLMLLLTAWCIWQKDFRVAEDYCIALLVANAVGMAALLNFIQDTEIKEEDDVPSIAKLESVQEKFFENLAPEQKLPKVKWTGLAVPRLLNLAGEKANALMIALREKSAVKLRSALRRPEHLSNLLPVAWKDLERALQFNPQTCQYTSGPSLTAPRSCFSTVVLQDKIYVIGGISDKQSAMDSVEIYDPIRRQWSSAKPLHEKRYDCAAVVLGSKIYVMGGDNGGYDKMMSSVEIFDPQSGSWTLGPSMNIGRSCFAAVVQRNTIYAMGGDDGSKKVLNSMEYFTANTSSWQSGLPLSEKRSRCAAVLVLDHIYVMGGISKAKQLMKPSGKADHIKSLEVYDPDLNKWSLGTPLDAGRSRFTAVAVSDKIVVLGGLSSEQPETPATDVNVYDPETKRWAHSRGPAEKSDLQRLDAAATVLDEPSEIYLMGGQSSKGATPYSSTIVCYDLERVWDLLVS